MNILYILFLITTHALSSLIYGFYCLASLKQGQEIVSDHFEPQKNQITFIILVGFFVADLYIQHLIGRKEKCRKNALRLYSQQNVYNLLYLFILLLGFIPISPGLAGRIQHGTGRCHFCQQWIHTESKWIHFINFNQHIMDPKRKR